jgi:hypothetical protein
MLKLTDDELTHLFQAAAPIAIERRDDFLEAVAAILLGSAGPHRSGHRSSGNRAGAAALLRSAGKRPHSKPLAMGPRPLGSRSTQKPTSRLNVLSWLTAGRRCLSPCLSLMLIRHEAASSFGSSRLSAASYGGVFSVAVCAMMHWACRSAFAELATKLGEDPIGPGKPTLLRRGFVMTDELMLFLALAGGFTVVLVEWWARQTP